MKPKQATPQKFSSAHFSTPCLSFIRPLLLTHARIHTFTENLFIHHQYEPVPPAVQWILFPAAVQQLMGKGNVFILSNLSRMWSHIWWESQFFFFSPANALSEEPSQPTDQRNMLWVDWKRPLQERNVLHSSCFWRGLSAKLCLPSQGAEEFADLHPSHTIWPSSDSLPACKSFFSYSALRPVPAARALSFIHLFSYYTFACDIKAQISGLLMSQCFTWKQKCFVPSGRRQKNKKPAAPFGSLMTWCCRVSAPSFCM